MVKEVIEALKRMVKEEETDEIVLDGIKFDKFTSEINKQIEELSDAMILSLEDCGLKSLDHFPSLKLLRLDLSKNKFPASELKHLAAQEDLQSLDLNGCQISKADDLACLSKIEGLGSIELADTPLSSVANYREKVFAVLPQLDIVDGKDKEGNDYALDDEGFEEGDFEGDEEDGDVELVEDDGEEEYYEESDEDDEDDEDEAPNGKKKALKK